MPGLAVVPDKVYKNVRLNSQWMSGDSRTSWLGSFNNESLGTPGLFCF